jgi:hypothetical protein
MDTEQTSAAAPQSQPAAPPSSETFEGKRPSANLSGPSSASLRPRPGSNNGNQTESSTPEANGEQTPAQQKKRESRYEQTKRKIETLRQREAQIAAREQAIAQAEAKRNEKPKRDYTLGQLKEYRQGWEEEGKWNLVEAADKKIAEIEAEEKQQKESSRKLVELPVFGTPEHKAQWEQAEAELAQADSEFMRHGTRLDTELRNVMKIDGNIYREHPRGIIAAYHRAKMNLLEADYKVAQERIQELETELQRQTGLTSIGGGAPGRVGSGSRAVNSLSDFKKLSSQDMRKHLMKGAKSGMPML